MDEGSAKPNNLAEETIDLVKEYRDSVSGTVTLGCLTFQANHYGVDASYTSEMKWKFGTRELTVKMTYRDIVVNGTITEEDNTFGLMYVPVIRAWLEAERQRWKSLSEADEDDDGVEE